MKTTRKRLTQIGFLFSFVTAMLVPSIAFNWEKGEQAGSTDVLIIYSTGTPFQETSDREAGEVDVVTTPTPLEVNCRSIAETLGSALRDKELVVRVAEATEIKHHNEILHARLVVIGSPAYFSNVSWRMKKLFDEQFHRIYTMRKKRLNSRRAAAFSMAEVESSARAALRAIRAVVTDCKGRFGPTMILLTKHSEKEVKQRIDRFADQLALLVKSN